jgi:hypothetical protein
MQHVMNDTVAAAIPDVAHDTLGRQTLWAWLDANAGVPLRYVIGQPGSGKTTAVASWAQQRRADVVWVTLHDGCSRRWLVAALTDALANFEDRACIVVIDDADRASPEARDFLSQLYVHAPEHVTFIYLARGFAAVDVTHGEQRGVVAVAAATQLRFIAEEVALYCEALDVPCTPLDTAWLATVTNGWAFAVSGIVRAAQLARRPLGEALALWRTANSPAIDRMVDEAARTAPARDAQELIDMLASDTPPSTSTLRRLERVGLFVERVEGRFESNVIVVRSPAVSQPASDVVKPLVLEMFGRFRLLHDGVDVRFVRRRDAQIVHYLALQQHGRATREKLVRTFWPDTDSQLGAQGLRTSCSAIRRAIAAQVGNDAVERYLFSAPAQIGLRFESVVSSAHRFVLHAELATAAEARGSHAFAQAHWSAALKLYSAPVLSGEPVAWWIERQAEAFAALSQRARRFLRDAEPVRVR